MKWVKVITTVRREDWVQVADNPDSAVDYIRALVELDATTEPESGRVESVTLVPPLPQDCKRRGIGYHPL